MLQELEQLVMTEGFLHLTVGGLAKRLKCSRRTLYQLAASKDDLILYVIDDFFQRVAVQANLAADRGGSRTEQLEHFLEISRLRAVSWPFQRDLESWEPAAKLFDAHIRFALQNRFESLVRAGIADGEFRPVDPAVIAQAVYGAMRYMRHPDALRDLGMTYSEAVSQFHQLVVAGLTAEPSS